MSHPLLLKVSRINPLVSSGNSTQQERSSLLTHRLIPLRSYITHDFPHPILCGTPERNLVLFRLKLARSAIRYARAQYVGNCQRHTPYLAQETRTVPGRQMLLYVMSGRQRLSRFSPGLVSPWESPGGACSERE